MVDLLSWWTFTDVFEEASAVLGTHPPRLLLLLPHAMVANYPFTDPNHPRTDVVPRLKCRLGIHSDVRVKGASWNLTLEYISALWRASLIPGCRGCPVPSGLPGAARAVCVKHNDPVFLPIPTGRHPHHRVLQHLRPHVVRRDPQTRLAGLPAAPPARGYVQGARGRHGAPTGPTDTAACARGAGVPLRTRDQLFGQPLGGAAPSGLVGDHCSHCRRLLRLVPERQQLCLLDLGGAPAAGRDQFQRQQRCSGGRGG